jgi:hypothetical protein
LGFTPYDGRLTATFPNSGIKLHSYLIDFSIVISFGGDHHHFISAKSGFDQFCQTPMSHAWPDVEYRGKRDKT